MDKSESLIVKGVAVSSMVFMHLFNQMGNVELCHNFIYIGETPIAYLLAIPSVCVQMFLFLSGYGLYCSNKTVHGAQHSTTLQRVLLLYARYWIILFISAGVGVLLFSPSYLAGIPTFVANFTGFNTTYNGEWWFIFPYIMLVCTCKYIFKALDKYNPILIILATGFLYLAAYTVCKYYGPYLWTHHFVYQPLLYCISLFSFVIGSLSAKYKAFSYLRESLKNTNKNTTQFLLIAVPAALWAVRMLYIPYGVFDSLLAVILLFSVVLMRRYGWVDSILTMIGKQSTNIWLLHSFFCYYFFPDFIYSLKYPALIFVFVMTASYLTGLIIDVIYKPLQKKIIAMFQ